MEWRISPLFLLLSWIDCVCPLSSNSDESWEEDWDSYQRIRTFTTIHLWICPHSITSPIVYPFGIITGHRIKRSSLVLTEGPIDLLVVLLFSCSSCRLNKYPFCNSNTLAKGTWGQAGRPLSRTMAILCDKEEWTIERRGRIRKFVHMCFNYYQVMALHRKRRRERIL